MTKRALKTSPRSVVTVQRPASSSQRASLTLRLEAGLLVEVEVLADPLGVLKDLRREGVSFLRDVAGLFEQRQIEVGFDVTLGAGIAVPVPGPAKIPGLLDDANVGDPDLLQPSRRQQAAKAAADDHHIELFVQRGAREARLDVGVHVVVRELAGDFLVLVVCVRAQTLRAFRGVLLAQRARVEAQLFGSWNLFGWDWDTFHSSCQSSLKKRSNLVHRDNFFKMTMRLPLCFNILSPCYGLQKRREKFR